MDYKRILTIQDISCVGQCSLTVALPILSACGVETCILPSAVLSTHTAGFSGYTFRDLSDDLLPIAAHWQKEGIKFDGIYTGYLGSIKQIEYVKEIINGTVKQNGITVIDPAMADSGKLYPAFDMAYVNEMKSLCAKADIVVPNITEACFLTDTEYLTQYNKDYIMSLLSKLCDMGAKTAVLTGVSYTPDTTGVAVFENGKYTYYEHRLISKGCHGTGDVYASAFVGAIVRGKNVFDAAKIAADFTVLCIENTYDDPDHWYGVKFETALPNLIEMI